MTSPVPPPPATRRDDLVDEIHGHLVADPFRWLEADDDPEVRTWVAGHNARTRDVLDALPRRAELHERLSSLLRAGSSVAFSVEGDRVF